MNIISKKKTDWNTTLNADKAGAATNAEDFTKQFMSQMFGGSGQSAAAPPNDAPPPVPTAMKTRKHNTSFNSRIIKSEIFHCVILFCCKII